MNFTFDYPLAWTIGTPLVGAVLLLSVYRIRQTGGDWRRLAMLTSLRAVAMFVVVMLAARPVWVDPDEELDQRDHIVLLIDRSESMSLVDQTDSRYRTAVDFARTNLLPSLDADDLRVDLQLFAENTELATGTRVANAVPDGKRTNLARAIARSLNDVEQPPLAVVALTDGATTDQQDNPRAIATLVDNRVPFIGIGVGDEIATQVLSLEHIVAPTTASPDQEFTISARLRATGAEELPPFKLALLRDGQFVEQKEVVAGPGARVWQESFVAKENQEGLHRYSILLLPPTDPLIKCPNREVTTSVRIVSEKELRILFVQGGLTWDYKFIRLAISQDPTIRLTGLSRTTSRSAFFQYVENADDLAGGFPTTIDDLARFRVVVLSNLRLTDLTPNQQDLLAQFCFKLGGGVLMIGGSKTFDSSWQHSRLEQLLPVHFETRPRLNEGVFRLQLTDDAMAHPAFQISDAGDNKTAWSRLPAFSHFAPVSSAKPGARVWATCSTQGNWKGGPILIASQRYGAGLSAVICANNLWRWRLAKESEPEHFDRFWRQLLRYLAEGSQNNLIVRVPDQPMEPGTSVLIAVEMRQVSGDTTTRGDTFVVRVTDERGQLLHDRSVELRPGQSIDVSFIPEKAGVFEVLVVDRTGNTLTSRSLDIKTIDREFVYTARNMETLGSWAAISDGMAIRCEDCDDSRELFNEIKRRVANPRSSPPVRRPAGINGWMLAVLLSCLGTEWLLRKRWGMT